MNSHEDVFAQVRGRAGYKCEYCGVHETESGGFLTIDHIQPKSRGGNDDAENLVYACYRCNLYKAGFWPERPNDAPIFNPRTQAITDHLFELNDGRILALTDIGRETIRRLRLNRLPLVHHRLRRRQEQLHDELLTRLARVTSDLLRAQADRARLISEENALLEEQQRILQALRNIGP